jgi:hypothetical protein
MTHKPLHGYEYFSITFLKLITFSIPYVDEIIEDLSLNSNVVNHLLIRYLHSSDTAKKWDSTSVTYRLQERILFS